MNRKHISLFFLFLMLSFASGCSTLTDVGTSWGLISDPSQNHLGPAETAINANLHATNAATSVPAQKTITAATAAALPFATESINNCLETMDMIKNGDYSRVIPGSQLTGCNFTSANFFGMNLGRIDLSTANLNRANLSSTNLSGANLRFTLLTQANLKAAILTQANLTGANLRGADLTGANLSGANLTAATVTQEQLALASNLTGAILPDLSKKPGKK